MVVEKDNERFLQENIFLIRLLEQMNLPKSVFIFSFRKELWSKLAL